MRFLYLMMLGLAAVVPLQLSAAAIYTVNSTADTTDANVGNGVCDVDLATPGNQCTLRAAILEANATVGLDTIGFNIPCGIICAVVRTITPASVLPQITESILIDGTTQPAYAGSPIIQIRGTNVSGHGLQVRGGVSTIQGLILNGFMSGAAVYLNSNQNLLRLSWIGTSSTGLVAAPNSTGVLLDEGSNNLVGGVGNRNVISGNVVGVSIFEGTTGNVIAGNYIGVTKDGDAALANETGIRVVEGVNTIGGTTEGERNVISGNTIYGVQFALSGNNTVTGNYIGTNAAGTAAIANGRGIHIGAPSNTIGGDTAAARNVISGNDFGIQVQGDFQGNTIRGNYIGTNAAGTAALGNLFGVSLQGKGTTVGGTVSTQRNVISGNNAGVTLSGAATTGNLVVGNFIGTGTDGLSALPNINGIVIEATASTNTIGGAGSARNVISGNSQNGILVTGGTNNAIDGNSIGLNDAGNSLPNGGHGVRVDGGGATLGTLADRKNVIAFNGNAGVAVTATGLAVIKHNIIHSNGGLGIDLVADGVTPNDEGDADTGPNSLLNFPRITGALRSGDQLRVSGSLSSRGDVYIFSNPACDSSGHGEGAQLIGVALAPPPPPGPPTFGSSFDIVLPVAVPLGTPITAYLTNTGGSSEFSLCFSVVAAPVITGFSPGSGTPGTVVTITGTGLIGTHAVGFAGSSAVFTVTSDTEIVATVPSGATTGRIAIDHVNGGTSSSSDFIVLSATSPVVTGITPACSTTPGGRTVTISGGDFVSGASVTFGGTAALNVQFVNASTLIASAPAHAVGPVTVTVTNPDLQTGSLAGAFSYVARGDSNGDCSITVADVFYLVSFLFAGGPAPLDNSDANGDGGVTVSDVFYLVSYLFAGGPPPA